METAEELESALEHIRGEREFAVDTESNSLYVYQERVCLVQVSTASRNFVFDPFKLKDMSPLGDVMENPDIRKFFHGADYDIGSLRRDFKYRFVNIFDTMVAARLLGLPELGLAALARQFLGVELDKKFRKSDWGARPIPQSHLVYLVEDSEFLLDIGHRLQGMLDEQGLTEKAEQQFEKLTQRAPIPRMCDTTSMWRVKGVRVLDRRQRAVFYKLFEWRESEARARDLPPFKVVGAKTLIEIAKAPKVTRENLRSITGVSELVYRRHGAALLQAAKDGRNFPMKLVPHPNDKKKR